MAATADSTAVQLRAVTCRRCGFEFYTPVYQRQLCTDCQSIPYRQRVRGESRRIDRDSEPYRWAHAVTNQRLAIEIAREVLGSALRRGITDVRILRGAMQIALEELDGVIDPVTGHTTGTRCA